MKGGILSSEAMHTGYNVSNDAMAGLGNTCSNNGKRFSRRLGAFATVLPALAGPACVFAQAATAPASDQVAQADGEGELQVHRFVWNSGGFYEGITDDGTPLQMNLQFPTPPGLGDDDGFQFESSYWNPEDAEKSQRDLGVRIAQSPDEFIAESINLALSEKPVHIVSKWSRDRAEVDGTLAASDTKFVRHFHLKLRFRYRTELRSWLAADAQLYGGRRSATLATYPLLRKGFPGDVPTLGLAAPAAQSSTLVKSESGAQTSEQLLIAWASGRYMFLRNTKWFYGFGAAHDLADGSFSHYAIGRVGYKALDLGDFYDVDATCSQRLTRKLEEALEQDGAAHPVAANAYLAQELGRPKKRAADSEESIYLVTPTGIEFLFGSNSLDESVPHDVFVDKSQLGRCADRMPKYVR